MAKVYGTNNLDVLDGDFRRRNGGCKLSGSSGRGIHDVAPQQQSKHETVRDEEQRHDDDHDEVGGTKLSRLQPDTIALIEGVEEVAGSPHAEHPD